MLSEKPSDQQAPSELDVNMIKVANPKQDDEEKLLTEWSTPEVAGNPRMSKGRVAFLVSRAMMVAAFLVPDLLSYLGLGDDGESGAAAAARETRAAHLGGLLSGVLATAALAAASAAVRMAMPEPEKSRPSSNVQTQSRTRSPA